jgi:multicomponent Na+:H+ antiporter subunit C
MSTWLVYAASGITSLCIGLWGMFTQEHWVRRILSANVAASGLFLILVALADRVDSGPPDPVPHALVLTGIVVSVSASALGLALVRRLRGGAAASETDGPGA